MAPGLKPRRAPEPWAATQSAPKGGGRNAIDPSTVPVDAAPAKRSVLPSTKTPTPAGPGTSRASKKLPPPGDSITEVYAEFLGAARKKQPSKVIVHTPPAEVDVSEPSNVNVPERSPEPRVPSNSASLSPPTWAEPAEHLRNVEPDRLDSRLAKEAVDGGGEDPGQESDPDFNGESSEDRERRRRGSQKVKGTPRLHRSGSLSSSQERRRRGHRRYGRPRSRSCSPSESSRDNSSRDYDDRGHGGRPRRSQHHSHHVSSRDRYRRDDRRGEDRYAHVKRSRRSRSIERRSRSRSPRRSSSPAYYSPKSRRTSSRSALRRSPVRNTGKAIAASSEHTTPNHSSDVGRTSRLLTGLQLKKESVLRQERRTREQEREEEAERREGRGLKRHFVNVSCEGKPYGTGINVWNDALAKLVRGLDPSYVDIRQQPFHLMEILLARLSEDFDYSETINPVWLKKRIGNALSSYRHELIRLIQAGQAKPAWISEQIWSKLVKIEASDKFRQKSEQMRHANSCRRTKGRTGPIGEVGVIERLRHQLGRSPEPDEVLEECQRDKGYSGRHRRRSVTGSSKRTSVEENIISDSLNGQSTREVANVEGEEEVHEADTVEESVGPVLDSPGRAQVALDLPEPQPTQPETVEEVVVAPSLDTPLGRMIARQVHELRTSPLGDTDEVKALIDTLLLQVEWLKRKERTPAVAETELSGGIGQAVTEDALNLGTTSTAEDNPEDALDVPAMEARNRVRKAAKTTTVQVTVRKSGRTTKPVIRD